MVKSTGSQCEITPLYPEEYASLQQATSEIKVRKTGRHVAGMLADHSGIADYASSGPMLGISYRAP